MDESTKARFLSVTKEAWEEEPSKEFGGALGIEGYKQLFNVLGGQDHGPWTTELLGQKPLFQLHMIATCGKLMRRR